MASSPLVQTPPPLDRTLDATAGDLPRGYLGGAVSLGPGGTSDPSSQNIQRPIPIQLVEGSKPGLSSELTTLLRDRLRSAALVLCTGFTLFFIRNFFIYGLDQWDALLLWGINGMVAAVLAVCAFSLCRKCAHSLGKLRMMELAIFGLPALFFLLYNVLYINRWQATQDPAYAQNPIAPWFLLVFNYAIFIPNTWRRAAVVIGVMVSVPILLFGSVTLLSVCIGKNCPVNNIDTFSGNVLQLLLVAGTGIFGVATINSLRAEVYEAKQLGQYKLKRLIGSGGMGEVYLAEHQLMKRPVALKLIRPGKTHDPQALLRFEREVRATAKLSHWNSIEIFDYGRTDDGTFYYVMEYLPGMNLADMVERYGPLPPERVVYLIQQVCEALGEAHELGLIHRDLKPGNIFSAHRGGVYDVAKLLDFGLAKPLMNKEDNLELTVQGAITGSPLYMSPEQATGESEPDARSDIYSLGAVMYYLLTGRSPFQADNPIKVLLAHASQPVVPPSKHRPELPAELEAIVLRCLEKSPQDRYGSTRELWQALVGLDLNRRWSRDAAERWWQAHCATHTDTACQEARQIAESAI
ncbi:MAG: serine/threonine-protein kinase [Pirellulales bacterium]|nr:serine/threonine-protein kinase [Pirellulales bacterium]